MAVGDYVAYFRVSTARQGRSGLGLDAQREAALERRPQLKAALAYAKKHKATLIIAKLDRLARNVHFISGLLEQRVTIVAADMPDADITMIQIYAVMAEREARIIGERTRAALAVAKSRGTVLGAHGRVLAARQRAEAAARVAPLQGLLSALRAEGMSLRRIAAQLNADQVAPPTGGSWHAATVARAINRHRSEV